MKKPQFSTPNLPPASEYALILGAGVSAVMSIATQQLVAASLPVSTLVAMGLLNRHRLDQRLKESEPTTQPPVEPAASPTSTASPQVTSRPLPESSSVQPSSARVDPVQGVGTMPIARFSTRSYSAKSKLLAAQQASLQKIGPYLKQIREEKAVSLREIHTQTLMQMYTLRAIEAGDLSSLPEPFYVRAFIEKYASALGLQGCEVAAEFPMGQQDA